MFTSAISDIIVSVTACGKQEKMSRMTLSERVAIEAGIYAHKTLTEIAERIGKSRRHVSEELRKNGPKVLRLQGSELPNGVRSLPHRTVQATAKTTLCL